MSGPLAILIKSDLFVIKPRIQLTSLYIFTLAAHRDKDPTETQPGAATQALQAGSGLSDTESEMD